MASGDTKTQQYLDIAAHGTREDIKRGCCDTRTQSLILDIADRIIDVEEEVEEIKTNPDVADIVATYEDLENYDTSTLEDRDIIRVLSDSTHDGNSTYYRYDSATDTFTYIGAASDGQNFIGTDGVNPGVHGLVPAPATTDVDKFLNADGTWKDIPEFDISKYLPTDTASGSVAAFPDGAEDIPVDDLKFDIDAVQNLNGYDYSWSGGGNKNLLKFPNTPYSYQRCTYTVSDNDVSVTANNQYARASFAIPVVEGETYTVSLVGSGTGDNNAVYLRGLNPWSATSEEGNYGTPTVSNNTNVRITFTAVSNTLYLGLYVTTTGTTGTMTLNNVQLEKGSSATDFAPYANICPITGWTGANIWHTGKNVLDTTRTENGTYDNNTGAKIAGSGSQKRTTYDIAVNAGSKVVSSNSASHNMRAFFWKRSGEYVGTVLLASGTATTVPANAELMRVASSGSGFVVGETYQIEFNSTPTEYEAFNGTILPISWQTEAGTVYGGNLDVTTGVLTVDTQRFVMDGTTRKVTYTTVASGYTLFLGLAPSASIVGAGTTAKPYLSNMFRMKYTAAVGQAYMSGANGQQITMYLPDQTIDNLDDANDWLAQNQPEFVVALATPVTYQLTPQEVDTLLGDNNIWSDTGDTTVIYKADIQKYIDKKLAAVNLSKSLPKSSETPLERENIELPIDTSKVDSGSVKKESSSEEEEPEEEPEEGPEEGPEEPEEQEEEEEPEEEIKEPVKEKLDEEVVVSKTEKATEDPEDEPGEE